MTERYEEGGFPYMMENTPEEFDRVVGRSRAVNDTGEPERVLTAEQWAEFAAKLDMLTEDVKELKERLEDDDEDN